MSKEIYCTKVPQNPPPPLNHFFKEILTEISKGIDCAKSPQKLFPTQKIKGKISIKI
jgi:hypothetical protein